MPAHIKWHVVVATTWPYVRHNEDVAPRQVVHAARSPPAFCLLLTANQFICLCDVAAICPATHTPPFPSLEGRNSSSKRCPHCCVRLTANMTRGCDWEHYVELLEMDSAVQPRGALSFSVLPPPLPALPNEVNLIVPCLASKENCFKRREAEQTLRLASDYAGRDESSPARALSGVKSDKTRPGLCLGWTWPK